MKRFLALSLLLPTALLLRGIPAQEGSADLAKVKEGLQELNEYIGMWKGNGAPENDKLAIWKEGADWSWRFKGKDIWIALKLEGDKQYKGGEMRYLPDREIYQFTLTDKDSKTQVFEGKLKKGKLTLERTDPDTKTVQQMQMNLAGGGIRFIYNYNLKPENRTLFSKQYQVAFTKEGESFGTAAKKVECVVTGGLGTIAVNYKGTTYYVCCSGCRDAFNEDPPKYIREYEERKKKGSN